MISREMALLFGRAISRGLLFHRICCVDVSEMLFLSIYCTVVLFLMMFLFWHLLDDVSFNQVMCKVELEMPVVKKYSRDYLRHAVLPKGILLFSLFWLPILIWSVVRRLAGK